jgi:hypothetical protein
MVFCVGEKDGHSSTPKSKSIMDLGPKKIYMYRDMKINFRDGKVTDIQ